MARSESKMEEIVTNYKNQVIGKIEGVAYYTTRREEHFMRKFQGFGISRSTLHWLRARGVKVIVFQYEGRNILCDLKQYIGSTKTFTFRDESFNNYIDEQVFVTLDEMVYPYNVELSGVNISKQTQEKQLTL